MAKRPVSPVEDEPAAPDVAADFLLELPAGGVDAVIWRQNPQRRSELDYLTRMPAEQFSLEHVKECYGGGHYRVKFTDARGRFTGGSHSFSISELFKAPAVVEAQAAPSSELAELRAEVKRLAELQLQAVERRPVAGEITDPIGFALKLVELMKPQLAPPPSLSGSEMLALLRQGMALGREAAGSAEPVERDPMVEMVRAAQPLLGAVAERIQNDTHMKRLTPAEPAPNPAPAAEAADPRLPSWLARIKPYLGYLAQLAQQERDPELYADLVLDQLPGPVMGELQQAAQAADFVDATVAVLTQLPAFSTSGRWLGEFLTAIRTRFAEDAAAEAEGHAARVGE